MVIAAVLAELFGTAHLGKIRALAGAIMVVASAATPGAIGLLFDAGVSLEAICIGFAVYADRCGAVTFVLPNPRAARHGSPRKGEHDFREPSEGPRRRALRGSGDERAEIGLLLESTGRGDEAARIVERARLELEREEAARARKGPGSQSEPVFSSRSRSARNRAHRPPAAPPCGRDRLRASAPRA